MRKLHHKDNNWPTPFTEMNFETTAPRFIGAQFHKTHIVFSDTRCKDRMKSMLVTLGHDHYLHLLKSFNPVLCPSLYQLNYNFRRWNQVPESFKILQRDENQRKGLEHPSENSVWTWAVTLLATCCQTKSHSDKNNTWWTTIQSIPGLSIHFCLEHWT